jgi:hypothetical protein
MSGYYNDVFMQQEHRADLLREVEIDRLAREAAPADRDATARIKYLVEGLSCRLIRFGNRLLRRQDHRLGEVGTWLMGRGLGLWEWAAGSNVPCACCT